MSKIALSGPATGTATFTITTPAGTSTDRTLDLPDAGGTMVLDTATQTLTNKTIQSSTIQGGALTLATAVASTSGTSIDFTSIPSWVKRITVMFAGVSTNGGSQWLIQIGDSGGVENTGYLGSSSSIASTVATTTPTAGFGVFTALASRVQNGSITLSLLSGTTWVAQGVTATSDAAITQTTAGSKTLSDTLDRVRITTVNGTDAFDAGTINIMYEG
jgi:hypothetical protein